MIDPPRPGRTSERDILRYDAGASRATHDWIVTEEPLELRLVAGAETRTLAVTMRTPGNDFELAAGFVVNEGVVPFDEIAGISFCVDPTVDPEQRYNIVNIELRSRTLPDIARFERHFTMTSSCGVCGKANLDALRGSGVAPLDDSVQVPIDTIYALIDKMRDSQRIFEDTGGLHAAAIFARNGALLAVREDVGRHNALDKLCGWALTTGAFPLSDRILLVSGRASYEILQKAAVARIPIVCAVSAPSSLAVDLANEFNITLVGFVRDHKANIYSGHDRISR